MFSVSQALNSPRLQLTLVRAYAFPSFWKMVRSSGPLKESSRSSWMLGALVDDATLYWWPPVLMAMAMFLSTAYRMVRAMSSLVLGWTMSAGLRSRSTP